MERQEPTNDPKGSLTKKIKCGRNREEGTHGSPGEGAVGIDAVGMAQVSRYINTHPTRPKVHSFRYPIQEVTFTPLPTSPYITLLSFNFLLSYLTKNKQTTFDHLLSSEYIQASQQDNKEQRTGFHSAQQALCLADSHTSIV